jgi:hypothetical protein
MLAAPWLRALVLRLFGLLAFILAALAAISLLVYGIVGSPSWVTSAASAFADWVSAPLTDWVAVLVGIGLVILAAVFALLMVPRRPSMLWVIHKGQGGRTLLDVPSVAQALQAELQVEINPNIVVKVKRGRLRVVTPFAASRPFELVDEAGKNVRQHLQKLGLESFVPYEVTTGRETRRRVQ